MAGQCAEEVSIIAAKETMATVVRNFISVQEILLTGLLSINIEEEGLRTGRRLSYRYAPDRRRRT